jgi:uncharacterized protein YkwD
MFKLPLAVAAAALLTLAIAGSARATVRCSPGPHAGRTPAAVLRLLNAARADAGAPPLRLDRRLNRSSRRHSCDMVAHHYFAHESRSGARFSARIARTGWMRGRRRWNVGENLAWGAGSDAAPRAIVQAWLQSPPHRHNLLAPGFRVVGIGIVAGTPIAGKPMGRTYTTDFGS